MKEELKVAEKQCEDRFREVPTRLLPGCLPHASRQKELFVPVHGLSTYRDGVLKQGDVEIMCSTDKCEIESTVDDTRVPVSCKHSDSDYTHECMSRGFQ